MRTERIYNDSILILNSLTGENDVTQEKHIFQANPWQIPLHPPEVDTEAAAQQQLPDLMARLLKNRGISSPGAIQAFIAPTRDQLREPGNMAGLLKGSKRIARAIAETEKITVYGDYDVDGITATTLMVKGLRALGAQVEYYIPDRFDEGYGLNIAALTEIAAGGTTLVITVDCGVNSVTEVAALAGKMDFVITDHHQVSGLLPAATAVINPHQPGCPYPFKGLAGVGVAYKVVQAVTHLCRGEWNAERETTAMMLAAIGTIADIVPLLDENRVFVVFGLQALRLQPLPGLAELAAVAGVQMNTLDEQNVAFQIAPRLNAAGRMAHAGKAVALLLAEERAVARTLAEDLDKDNELRRAVELQIINDIELRLDDAYLAENAVLVLHDASWHHGVLGIVAARVVEKHKRPVILLGGGDVAKGSGRSIPGFSLHQALQGCAELLLSHGGHAMAAGVSLEVAVVPKLQQQLNRLFCERVPEGGTSPLPVDGIVTLREINEQFLQTVQRLAPFGEGNPEPLFVLENATLADSRLIGKENRHFRGRLSQEQQSRVLVAWNYGERLQHMVSRDCQVDVVFAPQMNEWQGRRSIQLVTKDIRTSQRDAVRKLVGCVYLILKNHSSSGGLERDQIGSLVHKTFGQLLTVEDLEAALTVLKELGLLGVGCQEGDRHYRLTELQAGKFALEQSPTYRHIWAVGTAGQIIMGSGNNAI